MKIFEICAEVLVPKFTRAEVQLLVQNQISESAMTVVHVQKLHLIVKHVS